MTMLQNKLHHTHSPLNKCTFRLPSYWLCFANQFDKSIFVSKSVVTIQKITHLPKLTFITVNRCVTFHSTVFIVNILLITTLQQDSVNWIHWYRCAWPECKHFSPRKQHQHPCLIVTCWSSQLTLVKL